jgi:ABC-type multidrug transport system fused ATPase/permease subunit
MNQIPVAEPAEVRRSTRKLLVSHPAESMVALVTYAAAVVAGLLTPYILGRLVQQVSNGEAHVLAMTAAIFVAVVVQAVLLWAATSLTTSLAERVAAELRERFVTDLMATPLARIESAPFGDLITRSTRDVTSVVQVASEAVPSVIVTLLTIIATGIAMLVVGWYFLACLAVALPILMPVARWYLRQSRAGYLAEQASYADATQVLTESIRGARTVAGHGLQQWRRDRMHDAADIAYQAGWYTLWLRSVFLPLSDTAIALPAVAVLFFGGVSYFNGLASIAAVTTATLYAQQLSRQADLLLYQQDKLQVGGAALARLLGLNSLRDSADKTRSDVPEPPHQLTLREVSFAYVAGHDVLHDIDIDITPGERVAVVGPSGAGKSTLARLLVGIDAPTRGSVAVNGVQLEQLPREPLSRELIMLTQHSFVFDGSIRDNLLIAAPNADNETLLQVLDAVGGKALVDTFGLATPIREAGRDLSPAEQQLLSLARIVLTDPSTLVLDEATSQFDPRLARGLERSLSTLLAGRTVISIAHRLHSAQDADRVLVMQHGRIVEDGSHDELIGRGGLYARLWATWHGERQAAAQ